MSIQTFRKFAPTLKEIRIHLCPQSQNSNGTRQFIEKYYLGIKQMNPNLPVLIRECTGVEPKIWLRFEYGQETSASLSSLNAEQIASLVKEKVAS